MAAAAVLNFAKGGILLGYGNSCVGNISQCTKCDESIDESIFIYD